jgi:hypothetical protein
LLAAMLGLLVSSVPAVGNARSPIVAAGATMPSLTVHLRAGAPTTALRIPAEVRWSGVASDPDSRYRLQGRVDGGSWIDVALVNSKAVQADVTLDSWRVHEFRIAARSATGEQGPWTLAPRVRARQAIQTETGASYPGTWQRTIASPWLEGATRWTRDSEARVRFSVRALGIAWVASMGPDRGRADVTIDGVTAATIDLRTDALRYRRVVWAQTWSSTDRHDVDIRAAGAAARRDAGCDGVHRRR